MLANFNHFVKKNETDILLFISIVLIALIAFGAGYLVAPQNNQSSIIFHEAPASVIKSVFQEQGTDEQVFEGKLVGSVNSDKYHWPECQWAQRIAEENKIWFNSEAEAQAAGYQRCGNFEKYAP